MKIRKAFKYKLKPNSKQENLLSRFAGCSRFVWNRALALVRYSLDQSQGYLNYNALAEELTIWKQIPETSFLKEVHSQPLQQTLKDLDGACKDAFKKTKGFPRFKKKGSVDSFRYPQGVKIDDSHVFLPKIGKIKFQKSREIEGTIKNTTISRRCGKWYVAFQVEIETEIEQRPLKNSVGVDLGIANFAYLSNGATIEPLNSFKRLKKKLAKKKKFSSNWKKQKSKISRIHAKIADCRKDFLQKRSSMISKNHAMIVLEDLKVSNMSASAKGDLENPGRNVKAKSGLNRSILDQGWFEFRRMLEYKQHWSGGLLVAVNPKNTSRRCSACGYTNKDNRKTQAVFVCGECGHEDHADHNAAKNILEAGLASLACGDIKPVAA